MRKKKKEPARPTTLEECMAMLIAKTPAKNLRKFQDMTEKTAGATVHFSGGMAMRNAWGLWDPGSPLAQWFHRVGIWHADDMSGIIFDSTYRKLNSKPLDLAGQVKHYQDYWAKMGMDSAEEIRKARKQASL